MNIRARPVAEIALREIPRARVVRMWEQIKRDRAPWLPDWHEVVDFVVPRRGRFLPYAFQSSGMQAPQVGSRIVNSAASRAVRTLASGIMTSLTSPARPWFRLTTTEPQLAEVGAVRQYLDTIQHLVQWVFARSNFYRALHVLYRDTGSIGTAPLHIDADAQDIMRAHVYPVGQYGLACDARQRVDTAGREFLMTVRQLAQRFGRENLTRHSLRLLNRGELNQTVAVLHLIAPNEDFQFGVPGLLGFPWWSMWLELSAGKDEGFLAVKGYRQFPVATGRWEVTGTEDVYGHSPTIELLPDIKQLQHLEETKINLVDTSLTPPTQGPAGLDPPSMLAGAFALLPSMVPTSGAGSRIEPIHVPDYNAIQQARYSVAELENRIDKGLYVDLWRLLIDRGPDQQIGPGGRPVSKTASEIAAQHEEKLTLLGPVVDGYHNDVLSTCIRRTIAILGDRNGLPQPPRDLVEQLRRGNDVRIEYLSVLAQAQRLLGLGSLERFASLTRALMDLDPRVVDKVDLDEGLDQAADMLGIPPSVVRSDDQVVELRVARARQQAAMAAQAQAAQAASTAKTLGQTPATGDTALARILAAEYGPVAESTITPATAGVPQ